MTARMLIIQFLVFCSLVSTANPVPNYPLVDHRGKPFQLYDLKGQHILLSFVFTRCPQEKMCPLTITLNKQVARQLAKAPKAVKIRFLLVTLDPEHDTPKVLAAFAKGRALDTSLFTLATGHANVLADLASQFNVIGFPSGGTSLLSHNLKTILLDPTLNTVKEFKDNEWEPKDVIRALLNNVS